MVSTSIRRGSAAAFAAVFALGTGFVVSSARAQSPSGGSPSAGLARHLALNKPLPEFSVTDVATGRSLGSASEESKKATVLIFVSVQCPVSNAYNDRIEQIATEYGSKGVAVIGINANATETVDATAAHAKRVGWTFPVCKDVNNKVADAFGAHVTPEVYVTDKNGILVYHGPIDDSKDASAVTHHYLADALDEVLVDKPVAVPSARAFGCSIKRS